MHEMSEIAASLLQLVRVTGFFTKYNLLWWKNQPCFVFSKQKICPGDIFAIRCENCSFTCQISLNAARVRVQTHSGQPSRGSSGIRHHQNLWVGNRRGPLSWWLLETSIPLPASEVSRLHVCFLSGGTRQQTSHEEEEPNDSKRQDSEQSKLPICCWVWWSVSISVHCEWGAAFLMQLKTLWIFRLSTGLLLSCGFGVIFHPPKKKTSSNERQTLSISPLNIAAV